jgi:two-component SAPR family response regulator
LLQTETRQSAKIVIVILILLPLIAASFLILIINRRRKKNGKGSGSLLQEIKELPKNFNLITDIKPMNRMPKAQSILLLGGFQVIDKEGNNKTGEFTPILKQLFILILLYTLKSDKGISSFKLKEIFWFDKTDESAKNNRSVSLSRLRVIFDQIGKVSISSQNSYWTVHFGDDIYCDYYEALILIDRFSAVDVLEFDLKDLKRLISIASGGELLPNIQTEWVDSFKSSFSNRLIDLLLAISSNPAYQLDMQTKLDIADVIFVHDSLNEDALKLKCITLVKTGKNGLAKKVYTSFVHEYKTLFGIDFKYSFEQIIS